MLPTVGDPRQQFHGGSATRTCTTAEKSLSYGWGKCVFICRYVNKGYVPDDVGIVTCMHTCCTCLLLNATSTHSPSICPSIRRHLLISALFMHLPTVLWAWIREPATVFGRTDPYYTVILYSSCGLNKRPAATLAFLLSVSVLSSQYLFQRGPIWVAICSYPDFLAKCRHLHSMLNIEVFDLKIT